MRDRWIVLEPWSNRLNIFTVLPPIRIRVILFRPPYSEQRQVAKFLWRYLVPRVAPGPPFCCIPLVCCCSTGFRLFLVRPGVDLLDPGPAEIKKSTMDRGSKQEALFAFLPGTGVVCPEILVFSSWHSFAFLVSGLPPMSLLFLLQERVWVLELTLLRCSAPQGAVHFDKWRGHQPEARQLWGHPGGDAPSEDTAGPSLRRQSGGPFRGEIARRPWLFKGDLLGTLSGHLG